MSAAVLEAPKSELKCRACGATHIARSDKRNLCIACADGFARWLRQMGMTDQSPNGINRWLARRLMLEAKRLQKFGVTGRCEAVSRGPRGWLDGLNSQCRGHATALRDGRRVCSSHAKATQVLFAGTTPHDPYNDMQRLMSELAKIDARFRACLEAALR